MVIEDYFQVNSQFFYSKSFDLGFFKKCKRVPLKNLSQKSVSRMLETVAFDSQDIYLLIDTNIGKFIYMSATNVLPHKEVLDYLKLSSKTSPIYYFSNVDYFSFGRFGLGEEGKVSRYLSFNSEPEDEENVVEWIGKPHKWEYATHTFYTKQKLEDFDMDFSSFEVCDMITYYIPEISNDVEIYSIDIYSTNSKKISNIKRVQKGVYKKLNSATLKNLYLSTSKNRANAYTICGYVGDGKIIFTNHMLYTIDDISVLGKEANILYSSLRGEIDISDVDCQLDFHNILIQMVEDIVKANVYKIKDVGANIQEIERKNYHHFYILVTPKSKSKVELMLSVGDFDSKNIRSIKIGNNLSKSHSIKILDLIKSEYL